MVKGEGGRREGGGREGGRKGRREEGREGGTLLCTVKAWLHCILN